MLYSLAQKWFRSFLYRFDQINTTPKAESTQWIKSHHVQKILGISPGTLQTLRLNGTIPYTKIGGVLFYDRKEINALLEDNMRNRRF